MNQSRRALRDFQDYAEDVNRARHNAFQGTVRRLVSTLVPNTPLGTIAAQLPAVDFDDWHAALKNSVRGMVGSGQLVWPDDRGERVALQVELLRRLANGQLDVLNFTLDFIGSSQRNLDDITSEFGHQVFRGFVRDFLRLAHDSPDFERSLNETDGDRPSDTPMADDLTLFISHSGDDAPVAKALVELFQKALRISARKIRCTSVDGYRLPAGANTDAALRTEVFGATVLVAVLTSTSLSSTYVLFELGARWGAQRVLFPVLARGAAAKDLTSPLSGLNALDASNRKQVLQLVEDLAEALSEKLEPMSAFSAEVDAVVAVATV